MEKVEVAIFYCQRQTEQVQEILKTLNGPVPPGIRKIALPCSGKLEVSFLLKALENGADGVAVIGCEEGECRYLIGSTRAKNRVSHARRIVRDIGLEEERLQRFSFETPSLPENLEALGKWMEKIKGLGPLAGNLKAKMQE